MPRMVGRESERVKPLNLAHRGASAYAPENTLAAFRLALELGADGVEFDVTLTRDGVPVIIHDDTVDRTTDGHGPIRTMSLQQVKKLDAGAKYPRYRGECIPTLEEALEAIGQRATINIELKTVSIRTNGIERVVADVIANTRTQERVIVSSFNPFALARMKSITPGVPRGLLYAPNLPIYLRRAWLRPIAQPTALHPRHDMVSKSYAKWAKCKQLPINTWTVDEPDEMSRLIDLGVNVIMTNKPDILKRQLGGE